MNALKNILVGIDYSVPSTGALREAARCAACDGARLTALHVIDAETLQDLKREVEIDEDAVLEIAQRRLGIHLDETLGKGHGSVAETVIGYPLEEIALAADRLQADLIVLGSHGRKSADPGRVGVLATRCVRKAKQNVLLVRASQDRPFRKIVACIDFSETSRKAAKQAIHLAQQDGASVEFLHVYRPVSEIVADPDFYTGALPPLPSETGKNIAERLEGKLQEFVRGLAPELGELRHRVSLVEQFKPRAAIAEYINETGADLVVLGTRGRTSLRNLLMGSTTERILHRANCSTLAVKPDGFEYALN